MGGEFVMSDVLTVVKCVTSSDGGAVSRDATESRDTKGLSDVSTKNAALVYTESTIGVVFTE